MKKFLTVFSIAALLLTSTVAFADDGDHAGLFGWNHENMGLHLGIFKQNLDSSKFIIVGTVSAMTSDSITVNVQKQVNTQVAVNSQATVAVNSSTKLGDGNNDDDDSFTLSSLKAGDRVVIVGSVSGSTLTATNIRLLSEKEKQKAVVFGQVTAVTPTSVTITNAKTGVSQTLTTNSDTKVMVDGQAATTSDIQVGDRGFVRFKNDVSGMFAKLIALFR